MVDGPGFSTRTCAWKKGETGQTVAQFTEGAVALVVFINAKDVVEVMTELTLALKEYKRLSYIVYYLPNRGLSTCFMVPDEKASTLLVYTEASCNYKHEFEQVDLVAPSQQSGFW
jgi:hypothetical protein